MTEKVIYINAEYLNLYIKLYLFILCYPIYPNAMFTRLVVPSKLKQIVQIYKI